MRGDATENQRFHRETGKALQKSICPCCVLPPATPEDSHEQLRVYHVSVLIFLIWRTLQAREWLLEILNYALSGSLQGVSLSLG